MNRKKAEIEVSMIANPVELATFQTNYRNMKIILITMPYTTRDDINAAKSVMILFFGPYLPQYASDFTAEEIADYGINDTLENCKNITQLESYWKYAFRHQADKKMNEASVRRITGLGERPDLILEVGYFIEETGLFKKRVIMVEVDGHDKTASKEDSIKLALKLMSSTSAQIPINEGESFHIRSNFHQYMTGPIEESLMATTDITLPEFAELVNAMQHNYKDSRNVDYMNFLHAIHVVHHMFLSHVKVAFLIHMLVVHGIDMRSTDARNTRMQNHCFFVNFQSNNVPEALCWDVDLPSDRAQWLDEKKLG